MKCNECVIKSNKIKELKEELKNAYFDKCFHVYTRQGFLNEIKNENSGYILLLDFNDVSLMNNLIGYRAVNERFKKFFKAVESFDSDIVVGRWFSGDEIIMFISLNKNISLILDKLIDEAVHQKLSFIYSIRKKEYFEVGSKEWESMMISMENDFI